MGIHLIIDAQICSVEINIISMILMLLENVLTEELLK